jgi:hypothetical protein
VWCHQCYAETLGTHIWGRKRKLFREIGNLERLMSISKNGKFANNIFMDYLKEK